MAIKIEVISNAIVVSDTVSGETLAECPKRLVYYDVSKLEKEAKVQLVSLDPNGEYGHHNWASYDIGANLVDTGSVAYTEGTWKTFARTNLGA